MKAGDGFIYYSPTFTFLGKDRLRAFTAIGIVSDNSIYQFEMSSDFKPFRMNVKFCQNTLDIPFSELKFKLNFTKNNNYGLLFRRGHFEISADEWLIIASAMNALSKINNSEQIIS